MIFWLLSILLSTGSKHTRPSTGLRKKKNTSDIISYNHSVSEGWNLTSLLVLIPCCVFFILFLSWQWHTCSWDKLVIIILSSKWKFYVFPSVLHRAVQHMTAQVLIKGRCVNKGRFLFAFFFCFVLLWPTFWFCYEVDSKEYISAVLQQQAEFNHWHGSMRTKKSESHINAW